MDLYLKDGCVLTSSEVEEVWSSAVAHREKVQSDVEKRSAQGMGERTEQPEVR